MGKRKAQLDSDSCGSSASNIDSSDEYEPETRSLPLKRRNTAKKKTRVDHPVQVAVTLYSGVAHHSGGNHIIKDPASIRVALLQWYSGVHAARGMPWRKPYDDTLSKQERAQRAYEVWL